MDLFNNSPPLVPSRESPPLLCYTLPQYYLACSLDSRILVKALLHTAVHGHAAHALWDVIRKWRFGYRGELTRQSEILSVLYSGWASCHTTAYFILFNLT